LETQAIESIRLEPVSTKIEQFATDFPETERLDELKVAVSEKAGERAELREALENVYVNSARKKPTESKIVNYLRDFPEGKRLNEVTEAASRSPEVMAKVQANLEEAYLQKMEENPTLKQADEFINRFPTPVKKDRFKKIISKKPKVKAEAELKMQKMEDARKSGH
jgi:hypothetical protein